jgi:hypothetical protein
MLALSASLSGDLEISLIKNSLDAAILLAESVGFAFTLICPSLNSLILDMKNIPTALRWKTLRKLNDALPNGASLLHEHFNKISSIFFDYFEKDDDKTV